jgi:hypothetical protein
MIIDYQKIHGNEYGFPPWLMEKLVCPAAGEGVHRWIYRVGLSLRHYVYEARDAAEIVHAHITRAESPPGEIYSSLCNAYESEGDDDFDYHSWSPSDEQLRSPSFVKHIYDDCWDGKKTALQTLKECSNPIPDIKGILNRLYADEHYVCIGNAIIDSQGVKRGYSSTTLEKKYLVRADDLESFAQIVPNPMRKGWGYTKGGDPSERSKDNACADHDRKYAVTDFDFTLEGPFGEVIQYVMDKEKLEVRDAIHEITARLILYIAKDRPHVPLFMVLDTGNKSLHAWWDIDGLEVEDQRMWFNQTISMGTDSTICLRASVRTTFTCIFSGPSTPPSPSITTARPASMASCSRPRSRATG